MLPSKDTKMVRKGYDFTVSITRYRQFGCKYWIWGGSMRSFHHSGPSCFGTLPQSLKMVIQLMRNVSWLIVLHPHLVARINWYNMINMSTWQGQDLPRFIEGQYKLWLVQKNQCYLLVHMFRPHGTESVAMNKDVIYNLAVLRVYRAITRCFESCIIAD